MLFEGEAPAPRRCLTRPAAAAAQYLIKRGLIPQDRVTAALETVWSAPSKPTSIVRDAPETFGTDEAKKTGWAARNYTSNLPSLVFFHQAPDSLIGYAHIRTKM